jgi:hypothetical protein
LDGNYAYGSPAEKTGGTVPLKSIPAIKREEMGKTKTRQHTTIFVKDFVMVMSIVRKMTEAITSDPGTFIPRRMPPGIFD